MPINEDALAGSLRRLADGIPTGGEEADDAGLVAALTAITDACAALFDVDGSGIMLADEQNIARYVAASDGPGRVLESAESECGDGPCTRAFIYNKPIPVRDVSTDERWPRLAAIIAQHPVRAVLGVPVRLGGVSVGTIDLYRSVPHDWEDAEQAGLLRYSEVVEATIAAALSAHRAQDLARQLQYALDHRIVVERGVGFLMARERLDAVAAFNQLRDAARSSRRRIGDVATELLETGRLTRRKT